MLKKDAMTIYQASVEGLKPKNLINDHIQLQGSLLKIGIKEYDLADYENIYITGTGKASAYMAQSLEKKISAYITHGLITVKYDHSAPCHKIKIMQAGHPIPDQNTITATLKILDLAEKAKTDDLVIVLLSGGGSALMEALPQGIDLADLQSLNNLLISCGADIKEINTVRKHISRVKGGYLAQKIFPATCITIIISDVAGDNLASIASGPTAADPSTFKDAQDIINKYNLSDKISPAIRDYIQAGVAGKVPETLKDGSHYLKKIYNVIIGNNALALQIAKEKAESLGYKVVLKESNMQGEARQFALYIVEKMNNLSREGQAQCLLFGGETTVTITGKGKGGRNQELALAALPALKNYRRRYALLSCGTDGTDGPTDASGAVIASDIWKNLKLDPDSYLQNNDSYHFFEQSGGLLKTGPSGTNVMDLVIVLLK